MNNNEQQYLDLLTKIKTSGHFKNDRTQTGTYSIFGYQMRFDLQENFPLLTTKRVPFRLIASELLWFIKGDTNIKYLLENNNHIWDEWAFERFVKSADYHGPDMTDFAHRAQQDPEFAASYHEQMQLFDERILTDAEFAQKYGELGPIYGKQWRQWQTSRGETIDQLADVIQQIKTNPDSRRLIVSAWNSEEVNSMALPPCHTMFQFYVQDGKLSCQLYQRSGDTFLGVPFNIASYSLLTHLIAHETGLEVGEFIHTLGDAHIYQNHLQQVDEQLSRTPVAGPKLHLNPAKNSIFDFDLADLTLTDYHPQKTIKGAVAV